MATTPHRPSTICGFTETHQQSSTDTSARMGLCLRRPRARSGYSFRMVPNQDDADSHRYQTQPSEQLNVLQHFSTKSYSSTQTHLCTRGTIHKGTLEELVRQLTDAYTREQPSRSTTRHRTNSRPHGSTTNARRTTTLETSTSQIPTLRLHCTPQEVCARRTHSFHTETEKMESTSTHTSTSRPPIHHTTHSQLASPQRTPTINNHRDTNNTTGTRCSLRSHLEPLVHTTQVPTARPLPPLLTTTH